jgi:hypothetical protein
MSLGERAPISRGEPVVEVGESVGMTFVLWVELLYFFAVSMKEEGVVFAPTYLVAWG